MQDFISIQFPMSDYLITVSPLGTRKSKGLDLVRSFQSNLYRISHENRYCSKHRMYLNCGKFRLRQDLTEGYL